MALHLTENEVAALEICLNYDDRESQLSDNYSNGGATEFADELFNGNKQAAGGLIASLTLKGMGGIDEDDDIFWLSEDAIHVIFDLIDKR